MRGRFITRGYDDVTVDKAMAITVTVAVIQSLVDSPISGDWSSPLGHISKRVTLLRLLT